MRRHERKLHKNHPCLLPAAQVSDGDGVCVALQPVLAQLVAHGLVGLLVVQSAQVGDRVLLHGQSLYEVLVVHAHTQARVTANLTLRRL